MSSIRTGLTSVTFRALSISKIVQLAAAAGLDGIEWGGDIHVPAGDIQSAVFALQETEKAGLEVLSYGSYYHGLPEEDFSPVLAVPFPWKWPPYPKPAQGAPAPAPRR